jgi:hypothetical protein
MAVLLAELGSIYVLLAAAEPATPPDTPMVRPMNSWALSSINGPGSNIPAYKMAGYRTMGLPPLEKRNPRGAPLYQSGRRWRRQTYQFAIGKQAARSRAIPSPHCTAHKSA